MKTLILTILILIVLLLVIGYGQGYAGNVAMGFGSDSVTESYGSR